MRPMDIRALVLVNRERPPGYDPIPLAAPYALHDVAGRSPLLRMADRLQRCGVSPVTAVIEAEPSLFPRKSSWPAHFECRSSVADRFWREAENAFTELAHSGAELVLVVRLGAYAEVDFEKMVQAHLERRCRVSQAVCAGHAQEVFCLSASRRNDAASLLRSRLSKCRSDCPTFIDSGYVNPLADARDLRELAIDILTLKTAARPAGTEIRPGVWVAPGAWIDRGSRIIAPAFIGSSASIAAGAVVTRCTAIEHDAQIDCGTVIENSSVLPYSYVGAGLDLAHSVVGMGRIANLRRNATVEVADRTLIGHTQTGGAQKLLAAALEFLSALPGRLSPGSNGKAPAPQPELERTLQTSSALSNAAGYQTPACDPKAVGEFPSSLAVVRRYGNR
jgi:hypothetical protein